MPPVKDNNEAGFWESQPLANMHDQMLAEAGSSWDDWRHFDPSVLGEERLRHYKDEIKKLILQEFGDARLFVLKDPRICRFVPLYEEVLAELRVEPVFFHKFRNPLAVTASLEKRDGMTQGFASLVWLRHVLDAEIATRGKKRVFLAYEDFLGDWKVAITAATQTLRLDWPRDVAEAASDIESHLSQGLQHHVSSPAELEANGEIAVWVRESHAILLQLARDEPKSQALKRLSRIRAEFDAAVPIFGRAMFPEIAAREAKQRASAELLKERDETICQLTEREAAQTAELESGLSAERQKLAEVEVSLARVAVEKQSLANELATELVQSGLARKRDAKALAELAAENLALQEKLSSLGDDLARARRGALESEQEIVELKKEMASSTERLAGMVVDREARIDDLQGKLVERNGRFATLQSQVDAFSEERDQLGQQLAAALSERDLARGEEMRLQAVMQAVYTSTSWRISSPVRAVKYGGRAVFGLPAAVRRLLSRSAYSAWHRLSFPLAAKQRLKNAVFKSLPFLFAHTGAYKAWKSFNAPASLEALVVAIPSSGGAGDVLETPVAAARPFVPKLEAGPLKQKPVRMIAFYLPQFHPIPENDEWWGEGFTEWTNVKPAQPQFAGHHQPHVPIELGYYDLRDAAVQRQQIDLAKLYGIEGFCFYFYWFAGKRLLETPVESWLNDKSLDLPFCLCWANENWSRRWDGLDAEILIAQDHSPADDLAFIREVARYMRDPRYIRIDGKPLLMVYRPSLLPSANKTAERWRDWCRENGIGEIYLAYTQSFEKADPGAYGFDAAVEFPPNNSAPPNVTSSVTPLNGEFGTTVYDWRVFPERSENYPPREYTLFRSICPGWDNTARRKNRGTAFIHNAPDLYRRWLENAVHDTLDNVADPDERLVFVNAWNEWAEGAHLEPDVANGYAYLQATRDALENVTREMKPRIVIVSHDAHPHGAQYLALNMASGYGELGFDVDVVLLGEGPLLPRFAAVASVHRVNLAAEPESVVLQRLELLRKAGATAAIANTTVSGLLVPLLKKAGFQTVSLIHELPGVLNSYKLEEHARAIAANADRVLFAAEVVRTGFEDFIGRSLEQAVIRPQGVLRKNPFKGRAEEARRTVCETHGFSPDIRIVLSVAFVDHRKGPDIFIEMAEKVIQTHPDTAFIWIGHFDAGMEETVNSLLSQKNLTDRVKFVGFVADPMAYYAAASVYALTSREDPFPNVVLESAEVGVPAVAFEGATGAAEFIVEHGGRLASRLDVDDFADKVRELLDAPSVGSRRPVGSLRQYLMDILHHAAGFQRVSVVVPNYNYAHHLTQRLQSIGEQTYPIYELVVLDDASTDESVVVVERFLRERDDLDSELIVNKKNSGSVFRQWKKGVARCRGDLVWIAEADDFAESGFLEELAPSFADPSMALAYSQSRQIDGDGRVLAGDYLDYTSDISKNWLSDYTKDGKTEISEAMAVKNTIPNVSAVVFRRKAIKKAIADLGEELFETRIAGDWLIYLKILLRGKIRFSAKPLNSHRRHAQSVTKSGMAAKHLAEVKRAQEVARSLAPVSAETLGKAEAWLAHVRRYLGIGRESDAA